MDNDFSIYLSREQQITLDSLTTPIRIQDFLDNVPYSTEYKNRTPLQVMQDRVAHCLDGALFAAAALCQIGYPPLLLDMFPDPGADDDHVLAVYTRDGLFGAIAKSNFPGLRFREPIHRSLRELVITYFDPFFNVKGEKTLRSYTRLLNLAQFDRLNWSWDDHGVQVIEERLLKMHRYPLMPVDIIKEFSLVDHLSYKAGMIGVDPDGLFKPNS